MEKTNNVYDVLDSILGQSDIENVNAESAGFSKVPDGYFLSKVVKMDITASKTSGKPMVSAQFKILEDGKDIKEGEVDFVTVKNTKNRMLFINWVISDSSSLNRFVSDMLKFEDENGSSLVEKDYFKSVDLLMDALKLVTDAEIYIHVSTSYNKNPKGDTYSNLISFKRAYELGLLQ